MTSDSSAALLALEKSVRAKIAAQSATIAPAVNAALAPAVSTTQDGTGSQITSDPAVHDAIDAALTAAQQQQQDVTQSGHRAAEAIALILVILLLRNSGEDDESLIPAVVPDIPTATLAALLAGIALAYRQARASIIADIQAAYDGISGEDPDTVRAARIVATNGAVRKAVRSLNVRVTAAATTAVYGGFQEAEETLWRNYATAKAAKAAEAIEAVEPGADQVASVDTGLAAVTGPASLHKVWRVQSTHPCPTCARLDGQRVGLDEQFTHDSPQGLPVFGNTLTGPPRHPNCRCRIEYEIT